ncbi:MAG: hypothetical protein ACH34X_18195 [Thiolinea sp.]
MNSIYGGMLDGQRLYEEDQRRQKQWEVEQGIRALDLDFNQQALPFKVEALSLINDGTRLNNDFARQINPYKVDYQQILNEGGRIGNDSARDAVDWARQDRPITRQALIFDTQAKGLNNYGKQINNAEAAASAPFNIQKKIQDNERDWFNNQRLAINLGNAQFMVPYDRAKVVMDYDEARMKHDTNVATYPDQRRAAEADAKVKARESAQSYDIQGVNNAFRRALVTKNYGELGQSLSNLFDDDVLVQPQQDGKVLVTSEGKQQSFDSLDALHKAISMASPQTSKQSEPWQSAGNGYALNRSTGEGKQIYQAPQKQQQIPINTTAIGGLVEQYVGTLGLDMSAADKQMLQSDIQAGATGFMRQGDAPSLAVRKAYDQLAPSLGKDSNWFGIDSLDTYKGGGALDMGKAPTATPAPAPSGALDMGQSMTNGISVGTVVQGYRFKGGNPKDPSAWELAK